MVKVCRVPKFSHQVFSANELSGWADGIAYTPSELRERKIAALERRRTERRKVPVLPPPEIEALVIGY